MIFSDSSRVEPPAVIKKVDAVLLDDLSYIFEIIEADISNSVMAVASFHNNIPSMVEAKS